MYETICGFVQQRSEFSMSFTVFLDVDGVLNTSKTCITSPDGCIGVDDWRIAILAGAIKKNRSGDIVLTSDWKNARIGNDLQYLKDKLSEHNLKISGETKDHWSNRGQGIVDFLAEHPEIKDEYVVLDDNQYDFDKYPKLWERLLITNGIEEAAFASETPAIEAIIFCGYIRDMCDSKRHV